MDRLDRLALEDWLQECKLLIIARMRAEGIEVTEDDFELTFKEGSFS